MLISHPTHINRNAALDWANRFRQPLSIFVVSGCVLLLVATPASWPNQGAFPQGIDFLAFALVVLAVLGRIWCSLYISGYKEDRVVTEGPYAIVRNPLYVFSFLGALGLGLATRHLLIITLIMFSFLIYYPLVVLAEEKNLLKKFGQEYLAYINTTPRFFPRRFVLVEPDTYPVRPRHVRRALQEVVWFFWFFAILHLLA